LPQFAETCVHWRDRHRRLRIGMTYVFCFGPAFIRIYEILGGLWLILWLTGAFVTGVGALAARAPRLQAAVHGDVETNGNTPLLMPPCYTCFDPPGRGLWLDDVAPLPLSRQRPNSHR
jgi:hypothetical protein